MKSLRILLGVICTVLMTVQFSFSQTAKNLTDLETQANVIRDETASGGNTKVRIANMYKSVYLSSPNLFETYTNPSWIGSLAWSKISGAPSFAPYPGAGIALSTGSAWGTSITDNSSNWNTAFGWGNHSGLYRPIGYVPDWSEITNIPFFLDDSTAFIKTQGTSILTGNTSVLGGGFNLGLGTSGDRLGTFGIYGVGNQVYETYGGDISMISVYDGVGGGGGNYSLLSTNAASDDGELSIQPGATILKTDNDSGLGTYRNFIFTDNQGVGLIASDGNSGTTLRSIQITTTNIQLPDYAAPSTETYALVIDDNGYISSQAISGGGGGGDVTKVGTPANNQVGVWTGDGTIEGASSFTYDGSNLQLTGDIGSTGTRITKGWFTDLQVTNAIAGSITGNAATVTTNANLTGDVTSSGNATSIATGVIVNADINASAAIGATKLIDGSITDAELGYINTLSSNAQTQLDNKQPLDSDLTTIAGLTATTDNFIVSASSAWASRTPTQAKTSLALNNVDNTSDATKNAASVTLTNKTIAFGSNTVSGTKAQFNTAATDGDFIFSGDNIAAETSKIRYPTRTQSGTSYTLQASDENYIIEFTDSNPIAVTLPDGLSQYFGCTLINNGGGVITISATTTLQSTGTTIETIYTGAYVQHKGSNVWLAYGALGVPNSTTIYATTVSLSSAEILALNGTPKTLVAAQGSGTIIDIISCEMFLDYNSVAYTTNTSMWVSYNASGGDLHDTALPLASGTFDYHVKVNINSQGVFNSSVRVNTPVIAYVTSGNPAAGNSTLKFYITYRVITL